MSCWQCSRCSPFRVKPSQPTGGFGEAYPRVYLCEFFVDLYTGWPLQAYIKYPLMWVFTVFCSLFLIIIIVFTGWCCWLSYRIDKRWDQAYQEIFPENASS